MKKTTSTLLLLTGAFGASLMFGQTANTPGTHTPPSPATIAQREVNRLTKLLTLTSAQQADALGYFTTSATANAGVQANLQTARQSLRMAILNNDQNGIAQAANTIGTLTTQLTTNNAKADAALYLILTQTQQAVFTAFQGRGFGGPGPRGNFRRGN